MNTSTHIVDELKKAYGRVAMITLKATGEEVFFRPLHFQEYIKVYEKTQVIRVDGKDQHDFDAETLPYIVKHTIVWPLEFDIMKILKNPGVMLEVANYVMKITLFEDDMRLATRYIDRYKYFATIVGQITMTLVSSYGLDGYTKTKDMSLEEILDLVILSEYLTKNLGNFAKLIGKPNLLPRDARGRVNLDRLMNEDIELDMSPEDKVPERRQAPNRPYDRPQSVDDIEPRKPRAQTPGENIYNRSQQFMEKLIDTAEASKSLLAQKIQRDLEIFGPDKKKHFLGNLNELEPGLAEVLKKATKPPTPPMR